MAKLRELFRSCQRGRPTLCPGGRRCKVQFLRMSALNPAVFASRVGFTCCFLFLLAASFSAFKFHLRTRLNLAHPSENRSHWEGVPGSSLMTLVPEKARPPALCSSRRRQKYTKISLFFPSQNQIFTRPEHFIWKLKNQDELVLNRTKNFFF